MARLTDTYVLSDIADKLGVVHKARYKKKLAILNSVDPYVIMAPFSKANLHHFDSDSSSVLDVHARVCVTRASRMCLTANMAAVSVTKDCVTSRE